MGMVSFTPRPLYLRGKEPSVPNGQKAVEKRNTLAPAMQISILTAS
jgi:hypothetical protein